MKSNYSKLSKTLSTLALDSPFVIAQRMTRLSDPASMFSAKDQIEFSKMVMEKQAAAAEAYLAFISNGASMFRDMWAGLATGKSGFGLPTPSRSAKAANEVLRPYQKRASANARRLSKTKRAR